ncbi:MAG TPA: hypothetical protein DHV12_09635 [Thermotogae bacterium]|nr:hypothetical protein [Thermotogota bacterium]
MKKFLLVLTGIFAIVMLGFAQLNDVPVNHWAYDSVKKLVEMKILSGFPDGTFRGNDSLTRYQAAVAFDRVMQYLDSKIESAVGENVRGELAQLKSQFSDLRKRTETIEAVLEGLVNTLRNLDENYGQLSDEIAQVRAAVEEIRKQPLVTEELVDKKIADKVTTIASQLNSSVSQLEEKLNARMNQLETDYTKGISDLNVRLKALEVDLQQTRDELAKMEENTVTKSSLDTMIGDISSQVADINAQVAALNDQLNKLEALKVEFSRYGVDIESLKQRVASLESVSSDLSKNIEAVQAQLKEFSTRFASLETKDAELETRLSVLESTPFASQIDVMKEMMIGISKNVDELSSKFEELESGGAAIELVNQELKVLRSRVDLNAGQIAEIKVTLNNHREVLTELGSKVDLQTEMINNFQAKLSSIEGSVKNLNEAYKNVLDKSSEAVDRVDKLQQVVEDKVSKDELMSVEEEAQSARSSARQAQVLGWVSIMLSIVAMILAGYVILTP